MGRPCGTVRRAIVRAAEDVGEALTARELVELAGVDRRSGLMAVENLARVGALVAVGSRRVPWRRAMASTYVIGAQCMRPHVPEASNADPAHQLGAFLARAWHRDAI